MKIIKIHTGIVIQLSLLFMLILLIFNIELHAQGTQLKRTKPKEQFIELTTGVQLNYVEQGDTLGTPVILLHGYTDSWHSYEMSLPYLPPNLHVFALSQRGHGHSSKPRGSYQPKDFADDVAAFIKMKNLAPVVIVGHSMGGVIAQQFALNYPLLTKGLVVIGSDASFKDNPGLQDFLHEVTRLTDPISIQFVDEFQKATLAKPIDPVYYNGLIGESLKVPLHAWISILSELINTDLTSQLMFIDKPSLIFWGDKDIICSKADQDVLVNGIKNARLILYENTGHALHWEEPLRFANDITQFINQIN